jgi:hypothetical protein
MGWRRVREWLKPYVAADGKSQTAALQIFEGRCPNLVRTFPLLVHDEGKPEDVNSDGEDHAPDTLRYGLMSRPAPKPIPTVNAPSDFDAITAYKEIEKGRRQVNYIGGEMDPRFLRHLGYANFRGPSDR